MRNDDGHQYEDGDTIVDIFDDYGIHFFSPELEKQILLTTKKKNQSHLWMVKNVFNFFSSIIILWAFDDDDDHFIILLDWLVKSFVIIEIENFIFFWIVFWDEISISKSTFHQLIINQLIVILWMIIFFVLFLLGSIDYHNFFFWKIKLNLITILCGKTMEIMCIYTTSPLLSFSSAVTHKQMVYSKLKKKQLRIPK